jgi:predicted DNA-binding transcriptional regulator AlpA
MENLVLPPEYSVTDSVGAKRVEFIGIPEWCRRVGCSRESGYRAARRDEIPGLFRVGRLKRINWDVFVSTTAHMDAASEVDSGDR